MTIELYRIDDRLIHGQVVVGWGQPLDLGFIVLVDDIVATSDWEQELYRMGVPPEMDVYFLNVNQALVALPKYREDARNGILLTPITAKLVTEWLTEERVSIDWDIFSPLRFAHPSDHAPE